jgi:hypothetical protein
VLKKGIRAKENILYKKMQFFLKQKITTNALFIGIPFKMLHSSVQLGSVYLGVIRTALSDTCKEKFFDPFLVVKKTNYRKPAYI